MTVRWLKRSIEQPSQVQYKHYKIVSIFGRIGFITKAFIYAFIGGLTLQTTFTSLVQNESPQGVFILIGGMPSTASHINLVAILCGLLLYATWRFWEGITGQGYDQEFSRKKNFFRYRVSPFASGGVYTVYAIYIITLFTGSKVPKNSSNLRTEDSSCFPVCWRNSIWGNIGLAILAMAFTIATVTQIIPAFTGNFHKELDYRKFDSYFGNIIKYPFLITGHVGFCGRALLFFLVCFLFWKILFGDTVFLDSRHATIAQAINELRNTIFGQVVMTVLGISLLFYGIFAALCAYFKIFPTVPPSENETHPSADENSILP